MSKETAAFPESLQLHRNSAGGSGEHLPSLPTHKCSSEDLTNAMGVLRWVGLLPSNNDLPIRKYHSTKLLKENIF